MKKLLSIIAMLIIVMLGAYYAMGRLTEHALKKNIAVFNQTNGNMVELQQYHRGWFHSTALLKWVVTLPQHTTPTTTPTLAPADRVYVTEVPLTIAHGPIMWADQRMWLGMGYASSEVLIPMVYKQEFSSVYDEKNSIQPILKLILFVNYLEETTIRLTIPKFTLVTKNRDNYFKWLGMSTDMNLSGNKNHLKGRFAIQGFSWMKNGVQGVIGAVESDYDLRRGKDNFYLGTAHLKLASGALVQNQHQLAQAIDAELTSNSSITKGLFSSMISMNLKKITINRKIYGPNHADVTIGNLDAKTLNDINQKISQSQQQSEQDKQRVLLALIPDLPALLSKGAHLKVNNVALEFPEGPIKANIEFSFPNEPMSSPLQLIQKISGNGQIRVASGVLKTWLQKIIKRKIEENNAIATTPSDSVPMQPGPVSLPILDLDKQVAIKVDQKITALTNSGVVMIDGSDFMIVFKLENGRLSINGHPFSPAMLAI